MSVELIAAGFPVMGLAIGTSRDVNRLYTRRFGTQCFNDTDVGKSQSTCAAPTATGPPTRPGLKLLPPSTTVISPARHLLSLPLQR